MPVMAPAPAPSRHPPIVTGFGYSPLAPALWRQDAVAGLEFRDLSLAAASKRALRSRHVRSGAQAVETDGIGAPGSMFAFVFVLSGSASVTVGGETSELGRFSSATRNGAAPARWRLAPQTELIEVAAVQPLWSAPAAAQWRISHEAARAYVLGEGPRKYFDYRDLGVAAITDRRIHIHVVRAAATPDPGGTGWHCHTMGQLFYVLQGWANLGVAEQPWVRMVEGDAMCLAAGMRHNVSAFSEDYIVLEMCVPADYDTVDTDAPDA